MCRFCALVPVTITLYRYNSNYISIAHIHTLDLMWKAGLGPAVMVAGLGSWCSGRLVHFGSQYGRKEGSTELGDSKNSI